MEQGAYAAQLIAALFYIGVGGRLIRLSQRTGEAPERQLGLYFTLSGVAYVGWVLPSMVNLGSLGEVADFAAWIIYSIGVIPFLIFIRGVFRPDHDWAAWLVYGCAAALAVSAVVLIHQGERYPPLDNPFFWVQWIGYTAPCAWLTAEAVRAHRAAGKRAEIGLSDRVVVNRYLLLSIFGAFQTFACFSDILLTIDVNSDRSISALADSLLGGSELAGIATAWLAFCPPAAYLAWVSGSTPVAAQAGSHGT
jgi:hypothetical protein